jgi:uncharacterized membrane protein
MTDFDIEVILGRLLRIGVMLSAVIVLAGCVLYLAENGNHVADHHKFSGEPSSLTRPRQVVAEAMDLNAEAIIQFGIILLVLTPVARIAFSIFGFLLEGDFLYVVIGAMVLAIIVLSYVGQMAQ